MTNIRSAKKTAAVKREKIPIERRPAEEPDSIMIHFVISQNIIGSRQLQGQLRIKYLFPTSNHSVLVGNSNTTNRCKENDTQSIDD